MHDKSYEWKSTKCSNRKWIKLIIIFHTTVNICIAPGKLLFVNTAIEDELVFVNNDIAGEPTEKVEDFVPRYITGRSLEHCVVVLISVQHVSRKYLF